MSKKNKTIKGLFWSFTELISKQAIQLIVQILLARLLLPEHFGLIGMITIFIAISTAFIESGMDQALIRESNPKKEDYSTVFYFNLFISIIAYTIIFISAPLISGFFEEPQLIGILRVIMIIVIINAFTIIQRVILIRNVDFKSQTKISIVAGITSGIIALIMALIGAGVWSLVAQQVIMKFIEMLLLIVNNKWIPSLDFNFTLFKKYFNFGYKLLLSGLINAVQKNIYLVIIGKIYPTTQLGYFTNATKLRDVSAQSISQAIQKVTYPILSKFKGDDDKLSINYIKLIRATAFFHFPLITILAATSPLVIPFLLGELWEPSVPYFQLLCIVGLLYPIQSLNLNILKVKGRTDIFLMLSILKLTSLFVFLAIAVWINSSIESLIIAAIAQSFFALLIHSYFTSKYISYGMLRQLTHLLKVIVSCVLLFVVTYFVGTNYNLNIILLILIKVIVGITTYILCSLIMNNWELKVFIEILKNFKYKRN